MGQFEEEYLPLAREIVDLEDALHDGQRRNIYAHELDVDAETEQRAWQNYLGSLAYGRAYRAFMADAGGPEQTSHVLDAMVVYAQELEVELGSTPEQEEDLGYFEYDEQTIASFERAHLGSIPPQIALSETGASLDERIRSIRLTANGLRDQDASKHMLQDASFLESQRHTLFGRSSDTRLVDLI